MSSSALRYGEEFSEFLKKDFSQSRPLHISSIGGGSSFEEYSIHQIERIVASIGTGASFVVRIQNCSTELYLIRYIDGIRSVFLSYSPCADFGMTAIGNGYVRQVGGGTNMFIHLIENMLTFFCIGVSPIDFRETIEIVAIRESLLKAQDNPGFEIPLV